jgi:hypothetical protein
MLLPIYSLFVWVGTNLLFCSIYKFSPYPKKSYFFPSEKVSRLFMYKTEVLVICKYILLFAERLCFLSIKFVIHIPAINV